MTAGEILVLASASPRRQELMRQSGCEFRVVVSDSEEIAEGGLSPERVDSVVAVGETILGKPRD